MPYLNSDVFYWALPEEACSLIDLPPRAMAAATERGELDAGPLPMAEVIRLDGLLRPLGDLCVATRRASVSILLFADRPVERLDGRRVAVSGHTATAVQLMRVLFAERWKVEPARYVRLDQPHDAALLIGDPALQHRAGWNGMPYRYDLGEEWHAHTSGLPFVYARWVARRGVDPEQASAFERVLEESYETGARNLPEIAKGRADLGMTPSEKLAYLQGFSYRMGELEHAAFKRFRESLSTLPAWRPEVDLGSPAA